MKNTISLKKAKEQVTNWRKYYADAYNFYSSHKKKDAKEKQEMPLIDANDTSVFRGFFVKLEDLLGVKDIIEGYLKLNGDQSVDKDKIGIRVYLAKETAYVSDQRNMHVLIVPVINDVDIVDLKLTVNDEDATKNASIENSVSTIFDFSTPCPPACPTGSPLM